MPPQDRGRPTPRTTHGGSRAHPEHRLQVAGQAVHLPRQVHIAEEVVHVLLQLLTLAVGHGGEHRRGGGHPLGELLQQLVEVLRIAGEEVTELVHELLELGSRLLARLALLHHRVQPVECLPKPVPLLRPHARDGAGCLVEVRLHDLLLQSLGQFLERSRASLEANS